MPIYTTRPGFRELRRARIIRAVHPLVMTEVAMSKVRWSVVHVLTVALALLAGCTVGDGDFDDGGFEDIDGGPHAGSGGSGAGAGTGADAGTPDVDAGGAGSGSDAGGGAGSGGDPMPDPMIAMLADRLSSATCEALADCVGDEMLLAELIGGRDCEEITSGDLRNGELSAVPSAIEAGRIVYEASELEACAEDIAALGCDVRSQRWPASCELTLLGTVEAGGDCAIDQECAGDAFCAQEDACPGACTALLAEGAACTNGDDDQCEDGLVCVAATDRCTALGALGSPCGGSRAACAPGLVCFDGGSGPECVTVAALYFRAEDESCFPGDATCDAGVSVCGDVELCEPGLVCESAASGGVCQPATTQRGGDCKRAVPNQCPLAQVCDASTPGETGTCVDRPSEGEPCIDRSPRCAPGHICVDDTCLALLDNGESCGVHEECLSGTCGDDALCMGPAVCAN
jgi:hypothetical protein